jgi:hypothetical protein
MNYKYFLKNRQRTLLALYLRAGGRVEVDWRVDSGGESLNSENSDSHIGA